MKSTALIALLCLPVAASAEVKVTTERNEAAKASAGFQFPTVGEPRRKDAGAQATLTLIDGEKDRNSADLKSLLDGTLPGDADAPGANFFFAPETDGGRILVDLGKPIDVGQVNTYSWHPGERAPQVYALYASDGKAEGFAAQPKRPIDPEKAGWKLIAKVDTRPKETPGGQFGVSIADPAGSLGEYRYLLFDVQRTASPGPLSNTFLSEIDVVDREGAKEPELRQITKSYEIEGGYRFTIETTDAPDLTEWSDKELVPVVKKWYPLIVNMLPSKDFVAPRTFSISFTNSYKGVAATAGNRIMCSPSWYRRELKREALGATVHELVHVVQQYWGRRPRGAARNPGWLVEGLCDYIRWYLYEPESRGAEISPRNAAKAKYDAAYRPTGNFLNFVVNKYDKDLIIELNAAMREGRYSADLWKTRTKLTVEELAEEWKKFLADPEGKAAAPAKETPAPAKEATPAAAPAPAPSTPAAPVKDAKEPAK